MAKPFLAYGLYVVCQSLFKSWSFIHSLIQQSLIECLRWAASPVVGAGGEAVKEAGKELTFWGHGKLAKNKK